MWRPQCTSISFLVSSLKEELCGDRLKISRPFPRPISRDFGICENIFQAMEQNEVDNVWWLYSLMFKLMEWRCKIKIFWWPPQKYVSSEAWFVMTRHPETLSLCWSGLLQSDTKKSWDDGWIIMCDAFVLEWTAAGEMLSNRCWALNFWPEKNDANTWIAADSMVSYEKDEMLYVARLKHVRGPTWFRSPQIVSISYK